MCSLPSTPHTRVGMGATQINMRVESWFVRDMLRGDDAYEIRVKLLEIVPEEYPFKDDDV